jgi:hypothetical protein
VGFDPALVQELADVTIDLQKIAARVLGQGADFKASPDRPQVRQVIAKKKQIVSSPGRGQFEGLSLGHSDTKAQPHDCSFFSGMLAPMFVHQQVTSGLFQLFSVRTRPLLLKAFTSSMTSTMR